MIKKIILSLLITLFLYQLAHSQQSVSNEATWETGEGSSGLRLDVKNTPSFDYRAISYYLRIRHESANSGRETLAPLHSEVIDSITNFIAKLITAIVVIIILRLVVGDKIKNWQWWLLGAAIGFIVAYYL